MTVRYARFFGGVALAILATLGLSACEADYSGAPEDVPPLCRNYEGTANDSGYPCRIDHSDGSVEILYGP